MQSVTCVLYFVRKIPRWTPHVFCRCGDQILSVNGKSLQNVSHHDAVQILKEVRNKATMSVISWPGSLH